MNLVLCKVEGEKNMAKVLETGNGAILVSTATFPIMQLSSTISLDVFITSHAQFVMHAFCHTLVVFEYTGKSR